MKQQMSISISNNFKIAFTITILLISSWFLSHLLAIFGIFLAIIYPLLIFFRPDHFPCLVCQAFKRNEEIHKNPLSLALVNSTLILFFTLVSSGLVFLESRILLKLGFPPTPKTVSFRISPKGQYRLEEIFPMKIEISGIKTPINAVQADIGFQPEKLEVIDISTEDSFANIFIQKEINNQSGYARLTGGLPNPGFFADSGLFGTVYFKGKEPGIVQIEFLPSSMVLANDGRGTNALKDLASVSYLILPEKITKEEEEIQKTITLGSAVLGEKTQETQLKFYEEKEILGTQVGKEVKEEKPGIIKIFLTALEKLDSFIINLWSKIFNFT